MTEKIKLYRVENPNVPADPALEGHTSHEDIKGQWFSDQLDKALNYLPKATQYKPEKRLPFEAIDGAVLHIAELEPGDIESHRAINHPIVQAHDMDIEPKEDFIVPRSKIVDTIALDELVGESRGKMNTITERVNATNRVRGAVALYLHQLDADQDSKKSEH